jgi:N-acetylglucosaminyldiphosphoundecaprenol N-acetyl-beta-D-mannosaminyltransferase
MVSPQQRSKYLVGGLRVSEVTFPDALSRLVNAPAASERLSVHFSTAHSVVEASKDESLRQALNQSDFVMADGMPLVWAGKLQRKRVTRVCGPDMMPALVDRGREVSARHYFYGGAEGVPERLAASLEERFPGIEVVGAESPPFRPLTPGEDAAAVERINAARPDYVWVGLGAPKQDLWVAEHRERLDAAVLLAVGAAFDFHTGDLRRAPRWMQRTGLEWSFRLAMEPRRLLKRYSAINSRFAAIVAGQWCRAMTARLRIVRKS